MGEGAAVEATFRPVLAAPSDAAFCAESTDIGIHHGLHVQQDGILTITVTKKGIVLAPLRLKHNRRRLSHPSISLKETTMQKFTAQLPRRPREFLRKHASGQRTSHTAQPGERKHQKNAMPFRSNRRSTDPNYFASTRIFDSLEAKETLGSSQDDSLAIARRGSFLQDSFFSDIRRDFDASVREILKKCDDSDLTLTGDVSHSDILSRYRQLRSRNMREENQAFCVSSDSASLKAGEPQQNSLVNFSATEERKESSTAHDSTPEAVSSTTEKNISVHENLVNVDQMEFGCERKHSYENKTRKLRKEFEFPAESKEVLKSKICHNPSVDESTTASVRGDVPIIHDHELMRLAETLESTVVEKASYDDSVSEQQEQATVQSESDSTEAIILGEEILPIVRRGSFVQDSFFLDVRQEFDAAIREVLRKWVSEDSDLTHSEDFLGLSHSDILDRYRQLRSRELKEETQVFIVTSDNTSYKAEEPEEHKVIRSVEEVQKSSQVQRSVYPADETISLHEECEKESKATHDCMDSVESEKAREFLLSTDSAARSSHDTEFVESENQSKETIRNVESIVPEEVMTDSPTFVSDEMESCSEFAEISEASLCHKGSIAMTETSGNLSASRDFGTSSQDSLLSAIPEDENDSETVKVLHLEDSQQAVDILDLKDSEETAENLELKNSQESAAIVEAKGSEAIEILDLTDSQEDCLK
ncbi:hypothetical protein C7M84_019867 [Penaeus vannamei]|uniref:Uncharacterized protein n=1 Tax=Penaeus vannamei TaxID=6689 RepID=A0A3R7LY91_PENVA|nr:hypothetical protein C7M84_019867 [Penaeus vannamei]